MRIFFAVCRGWVIGNENLMTGIRSGHLAGLAEDFRCCVYERFAFGMCAQLLQHVCAACAIQKLCSGALHPGTKRRVRWATRARRWRLEPLRQRSISRRLFSNPRVIGIPRGKE